MYECVPYSMPIVMPYLCAFKSARQANRQHIYMLCDIDSSSAFVMLPTINCVFI